MNRFLHYFNLAGVLALTALCVAQWQVNRRLNLETASLEKARMESAAKLAEQDKALAGYRADLDDFRQQLTKNHGLLKEAETKLGATEHQVLNLGNERDQLKISVTNWAQAVTARDERLKETAEQLQKLATDRNDTVTKFNELATKYNGVVKDFNEMRAKFAALIAAQTNAPPAAK